MSRTSSQTSVFSLSLAGMALVITAVALVPVVSFGFGRQLEALFHRFFNPRSDSGEDGEVDRAGFFLGSPWLLHPSCTMFVEN